MSPSPSPKPSGPATSTEATGGYMSHVLPIGTMVGGLQITGLIGEGGFGIVYLAFDTTLQRQVALKEYMPSSLANRASNSADVSVKSQRHVDTFNAGLRSFVNEARLLAHFDHPALVKVHQFWQANRTAYMVMPFYQGPTLKAHVTEQLAQGRTPDEAQLRQWLAPLLNALETMHAEHCYHRDIAPDNILLTANGPLLLDFGAARRVISDMTQALTVILKPGYAPIEQYGDVASMTQGPWTDLYALASVIYFCITGHSPITSVERVMGDPLPRLARVAAGRYSDTFLAAIDSALAVKPTDRPQSVAEFRALLDGTARPRSVAEPAPGAMPLPPGSAGASHEVTVVRTTPSARPAASQTVTEPLPGPRTAPTAFPPTQAQPPAMRTTAGPAAAPAMPTPAPAPAQPSRRGPVIAGVAVAAALAAGLGWMMRGGSADSRQPATGATARPAVSTPAPAPAGLPAGTGSAGPATAPPAGPAGLPAAAPTPPATATPASAAPPPVRPAPSPARVAASRPAATKPAAAKPPAAPAPRPAAPPAPATPSGSSGPFAPFGTPITGPSAAPAARPGAATPAQASPAPTTPTTVPATTPAPAPAAATPAPAPAARNTEPAPAASRPAAAASRPAASPTATRCAELLKKGAAQPLTLDEATFLRKECR